MIMEENILMHPEKLKSLPPPFEIFELKSGEKKCFRVEKWEAGLIKIKTRRAIPIGEKTVVALRVYVPKKYKELPPPWWDITAKTLVWQLYGILKSPRYDRYLICVTKHGVPPKARFSVDVRELSPHELLEE